MNDSLRLILFTFLLAGLAAGCAGLEKPKQPGVKAEVDRAKAPDLSKQRQMLSEGYSMLYKDASNLDLAELILYAKVESDALENVVTAVAEVGGQLKKDLERIAKDYPGVRIDLDPLPEMEKRKRAAITKDRAKYFAPIVGHGGREYERTVLIGYTNGINHERHLCRVMAEAEPDASLKKFLLDAGKRYDGLYERVTALLDKDYFKDPKGKTKD
ncbi:MAG TPA: hypothetical protein VFU13_20410 [Steroidobacteraceae bacterium]|nr:hypothetical protein [Steroidobacteraceae bacterium]